MPGEMSHRPANAVHRSEVTGTLFFRNTFEAAQPFTAGEAELVNEWMCHNFLLSFY
jgi:hypothetical protein